jgi:hypothetical protein
MKIGRILIGLVVLGVIVHFASGDPKEDQAKAAAVTTANSAAPTIEKFFVASVTKARENYNGAPNDMAKGAARPARAKEICSELKSLSADNWTGVVSSQSSNGDGKGVLSIAIGPSIYLKTWNNSFSDTGSSTLIEPESPLFAKAVALKVGSPVRFSGRFIANDVDCVKEGSVGLSGSLTEPEYIFRFGDIAALR